MKNELKESLDTEEVIKKISIPESNSRFKDWTFGYDI